MYIGPDPNMKGPRSENILKLFYPCFTMKGTARNVTKMVSGPMYKAHKKETQTIFLFLVREVNHLIHIPQRCSGMKINHAL